MKRPLFVKAEKETLFKANDFQSILSTLMRVELIPLMHAVYHFVKSNYVKTIDLQPSASESKAAPLSIHSSATTSSSCSVTSEAVTVSEVKVPAVSVKTEIKNRRAAKEQKEKEPNQKTLDVVAKLKNRQAAAKNKKVKQEETQLQSNMRTISAKVRSKNVHDIKPSEVTKPATRPPQSIVFFPVAKKEEKATVENIPMTLVDPSTSKLVIQALTENDVPAARPSLYVEIGDDNEPTLTICKTQSQAENDMPAAEPSLNTEVSDDDESTLTICKPTSPGSITRSVQNTRLSFFNVPVFVPRFPDVPVNNTLVYDAKEDTLAEDLHVLEGERLAAESAWFLNL